MFNSTTGVGQLTRCEDYSLLSRLLKVIAYVLKFVSILKKKLQSTEPEVNKNSSIQPYDLARAEKLWIIESPSTLTRDN